MRIRWTEPAVRDFTHICDYIEQTRRQSHSTPVALSIYLRIGTLAEFREFGRTGRKPDARELIFSGLPYLAVYRIHNQAVEILCILHGAQDWP